MKKFFLTVLFLVIGSVVFFRGWTQIKIQPDECGIINSIFTGTKQEAVQHGKFSWNWEMVIPKTAKFVKFPVKPYNTSKNISGSIPQAYLTATYNDLLNYNISYSISLSYTPEALISLYEKNYISDSEDLQLYLENAADSICQMATNYILNCSKIDSFFNPQTLKREDLILNSQAYKEFPDLDVTIFSITSYKLPNYALYNKLETEAFVNSLQNKE